MGEDGRGAEPERGKEPAGLTWLSPLHLGKAWGEGEMLCGQVARPRPAPTPAPAQTFSCQTISSSFWQQRLRSAALEARSGPWTQVIISLNRRPCGS